MKEFFEGLFKPDENGETNAYGNNPSTLSLAGLMAATSGRRLGDVLTDAAAINRDRETQKLNKMKHEQEVNKLVAQQKLGQWMQENPQANNQQVIQKANELGLPFANIAGLVSAIGNDEKLIEDKIYGEEPKILRKEGGKITGFTPASQVLGSNPLGGEMPVFAPGSQANITQNDFNSQMSGALGIPNNPSLIKNESPKEKASVEDFLNQQEYAPRLVKETLEERKLNKKHYQTFQKDTLQPAFQSVMDSKLGLSVIKEAAKTFKTGTAGEKRLQLQRLANFFGIKNGESLSSGEALMSASNQLALNQGQKMKGAFSDSDREFLVKTVPSLSNSPEGLQKMVEYFERINQRMEQYGQAAEGYYSKYRTLEGFETAFSKYANKHNLFDTKTKNNSFDKYKNVSIDEIRKALEKKRRG